MTMPTRSATPVPTTSATTLQGTTQKKGGFFKGIGSFFKGLNQKRQARANDPKVQERRKKFGNWFQANKGTIGNIIPEEDMPFLANGVKPDLIINPHAIPSRMTIAQLKETLLGKVLVELGMLGDGTSFSDLTLDTISRKLQENGYESHGNELMYNGETGLQIETAVFIGPCFYQRLKHMVVDKAHSRSVGPMVNMTRQPAEGRSRDGGSINRRSTGSFRGPS